MDIGERIKLVRKNSGLTQEDFGRIIGLKKSSVSWVEKGKHNASDAVIKLLVHEFFLNEDWLRYGTGEMYDEKKLQEKALMKSDKLQSMAFLGAGMLSLIDLLEDRSSECTDEVENIMRTLLALLYKEDMPQDDLFEYYEGLSCVVLSVYEYINLVTVTASKETPLAERDRRILHNRLATCLKEIRAHLIAIAELTGLDAGIFSSGDDRPSETSEQPSRDPVEKALLDQFSQLSEQDQTEIMSIIELKIKLNQQHKSKRGSSASNSGSKNVNNSSGGAQSGTA